MRKLIILAAIVVIAMTAVVWSIATVAGPKFAGKETSAPVRSWSSKARCSRSNPGTPSEQIPRGGRSTPMAMAPDGSFAASA